MWSLPLNVVDEATMCDRPKSRLRCAVGRCAAGRAILAGGLVIVAGCTVANQTPLARENAAAHRSLVVSPLAGGSAALNGRNDASINLRHKQTPFLEGPGGKILYEDGSMVEFKTVREQLRDLKAEDR